MSCLPFLGQFCFHLAKKVHFSVLLHIVSLCHVCYSIVVCCILPCCIMMQCVALHCGMCCYVVVCCVAWWYVLLHCCHTALSCSVLFCTVLFTYCVVLADVWLSCPDPQTSICKRLVFSGASTAMQLQQFVETNIYHRQGMSSSAFVYLCMHVCMHACRYEHLGIGMICPQQ